MHFQTLESDLAGTLTIIQLCMHGITDPVSYLQHLKCSRT